jgi:predicted metal-dependent peptidase
MAVTGRSSPEPPAPAAGRGSPPDTHRQPYAQHAAKFSAQAREAAEAAADILRLSRNTLLINLRFLETALVRFAPLAEPVTADAATDGQFLYYNPVHICRQFKKAIEIPARDYLHVVLHCIFRHLFVGPKVKSDYWDLACDIAVENIITNLGLKSLHCDREERQKWLIRKLKEDLPGLTAERIYRYFLDQELPPSERFRLREDFYADDHQIWYDKKTESANGTGGADRRTDDERDSPVDQALSMEDDESGELVPPPDEAEEKETQNNGEGINAEEQGTGSGESGNELKDDRRGNQPALSREKIEQIWKDIAGRIEVDMDTSSNTWGESTGDMQQTLREVNREKYDYAEVLRKFAVFGENMEVNDDEFDYIFYNYGMLLYDRMPLIEPLEYKEVKRVREFVIALDTSESVAGELAQKFVTKTWNILKQTKNFFTNVNVHILQCGSRVEEDARITSEDEFDTYMKRMVLRGFGGTDFRPVFEYVNRMIREHEFHDLQGLIYFTDGYGTFPAMPPDYKAAFVFVDQGREIPDIPVWAIRLMLTEQDIELF